MQYRLLTLPEIQAIEAKVDAFFARQTMPGRSIGEARWKVLTAVEDGLRLLLAETSSAWLDPAAFDDRAAFVFTMDRYKYSLKHSLDLIEKSGLPYEPINIEKFGNDGKDYVLVNHLLHKQASLYADAVGTFTSIWSGHRTAFGKPNRDVIFLRPSDREIQYKALEALTAKHVDDYTPIPLLAAVFAGPSSTVISSGEQIEWGATVKAIIASTRARSGSVSYQFISSRGRDL
jgi:hypothetical protein